ncbi:hypothetical protein [Thermoanaerobacterium thermosaccharolyticum]|uniref:hypothetical protein n=1 Tax=Thermoanaerobacterium thermosaccharolyticum TaxID=1517 RepID=UPI002FDB5E3A
MVMRLNIELYSIKDKLFIFLLSLILGLPEASDNSYTLGVIKISNNALYISDILTVFLLIALTIYIIKYDKVNKGIGLIIILYTLLLLIPLFIGISDSNNIFKIIADLRGAVFIIIMYFYYEYLNKAKDRLTYKVNLAILNSVIFFTLILFLLWLIKPSFIYLNSGRISYKSLNLVTLSTYISYTNILNKRYKILSKVVLFLSIILNIFGGFRVLLSIQLLLILVLSVKYLKMTYKKLICFFILIFTVSIILFTVSEFLRKISVLYIRFIYLIFNFKNDYSVVTRLNDIQTIFRELKKHVIFGTGFGKEILLSTTGSKNLFIDNLYFTLLLKLGVIGFILLIFIYFILFIWLRKSINYELFILLFILLVFESFFSASIWYDHIYPIALFLYIAEELHNFKIIKYSYVNMD